MNETATATRARTAPGGPTNVLSIDVEDWFQVEGYASVIDRTEWDGFDLRVERNMDLILEAFDEADTRATFFVLGWVAERLPHLVKRIAAGGHELASHGWSHAPVWRLTPAEFTDEVVRSKRLLEALSGQEVRGYRAPTFSVTKNTIWALDRLARAGYQYDSSIFPVHHDRYGIPDSPLGIHRREEGIWELPMSVYQVGSMKIPVAGGGYFRLYPRQITSLAIRQINRQGRPAVVYLHPWEFDPGQPKADGASRMASWRHRVNLDSTLHKLTRLMRDFSFGTAAEVLGLDGRPGRVPSHDLAGAV